MKADINTMKRKLSQIARGVVRYGFRLSAISSEVMGPPKGYYATTSEWFIAERESCSCGLYIELDPPTTMTRRNPATLDSEIYPRFREIWQTRAPATFVAAIPGGRVIGEEGTVINVSSG